MKLFSCLNLRRDIASGWNRGRWSIIMFQQQTSSKKTWDELCFSICSCSDPVLYERYESFSQADFTYPRTFSWRIGRETLRSATWFHGQTVQSKRLCFFVLCKRHHTRTTIYLGCENGGVFLEVEREVAGEIETPRQPLPLRHHQLHPAVRRVHAQVRDCPPERLRVRRLPVPDAPEIHQRRGVLPAVDRRVWFSSSHREQGRKEEQQQRQEPRHDHLFRNETKKTQKRRSWVRPKKQKNKNHEWAVTEKIIGWN